MRSLETFTTLHMEAATCLWEAMTEVHFCEDERRRLPEMSLMWERIGTVHMRHTAISLSDFVLKVWDCMSEDEREKCIPYDWEFVPLFLSALEWDLHQYDAVHPGNPRDMAERILQGVTTP